MAETNAISADPLPKSSGPIARRHIDLVHSVAYRVVRDPHLAEDVTQAVFVVYAKKAGRIDPATLSGWLVNTTRLVSLESLRTRRTHEKLDTQAAMMRSEIIANPDNLTADQISPLLDDALCQLREPDRSAVVMRFLEGQSFAAVGAIIGCSEDTARKRVSRALEKLRKHLMRAGVVPTVAAVTVALAAKQASAAPAVLAQAVVAGGTTSTGGGAVLATAVERSILLAKIKLGALLVGSLATVGTVGVVAKSVVVTPKASSPARVVAKDGASNGMPVLGRVAPQVKPSKAPPADDMTDLQNRYAKIFSDLDETKEIRQRQLAAHAPDDVMDAESAEMMVSIWKQIEAATIAVVKKHGQVVVLPNTLPQLPANPREIGSNRTRKIISQRMVIPIDDQMAGEILTQMNRSYAIRTQNARNLRQIGQALLMYSQTHGTTLPQGPSTQP